VSNLSPYIRHGLVSLPEARDHAVAGAGSAYKFVQELAWREYWRHVLDRRGRTVFEDVEAPKHEHHRAAGLPDALATGDTGLSCVDEPLAELFATGYMHNHGRMWVASATTHLFQRHHAAGAALFAEHLLDHDPASNSLSWQWVDSSFAHRPYLYDRGNVEKWAPGLCERCPAGRARACPFETSYAELARRLLGPGREAPGPAGPVGRSYVAPAPEVRPGLATGARPPGPPVVWLHASSLGTVDPALGTAPGDAVVAIVLDAPHLDALPHSGKRLAFVARSALETAADLRAHGRDVRLAVADPALALLDLAPAEVHVTEEPDPWIRESIARLRDDGRTRVVAHARHLLAPGAALATDRQLGRFSRWWKQASREALGPRRQLSLTEDA
jgi:deoxyribodipyrimidine photo-lyase